MTCGAILEEHFFKCYFEAMQKGSSETDAFLHLKDVMAVDRLVVKRCCTTSVIDCRPCASNTLYLLPNNKK